MARTTASLCGTTTAACATSGRRRVVRTTLNRGAPSWVSSQTSSPRTSKAVTLSGTSTSGRHSAPPLVTCPSGATYAVISFWTPCPITPTAHGDPGAVTTNGKSSSPIFTRGETPVPSTGTSSESARPSTWRYARLFLYLVATGAPGASFCSRLKKNDRPSGRHATLPKSARSIESGSVRPVARSSTRRIALSEPPGEAPYAT